MQGFLGMAASPDRSLGLTWLLEGLLADPTTCSIPSSAACDLRAAPTDETRIFWGFRKARESQGPAEAGADQA